MISSLKDQLANYYSNRNSKKETSEKASQAIDTLKEKQKALLGQTDTTSEEQESDETQAAATDTVELTPEDERQAALKKILDKINAEEAQKYPNRVTNKTNQNSGVITPTTDATTSSLSGVEGLLNDMPLFSEFKTGLIDAFNSLDSATSGSISAMYELNYTSMQYVAAEGGGYEYKETTFNLKLDLNYIKASAGGQMGSEIASAIEGATDFASLVSALEGVTGQSSSASSALTDTSANSATQTKGIPELKNMTPDEIMSSLQDYFSPQNTAGRIVDFATMFFPMSKEFKDGGDTEEARQAFADRMGAAIQKGFDQALGTLGKLPKSIADEIDQTHQLTFAGLDDFVKNGLNSQKEEQGVYSSLEQFAFSFEMSYSEKTTTVSSYNSRGQTLGTNQPKLLNAEA